MAIADASGFPIAAHIESASPHEVKLVDKTVDNRFLDNTPDRLVGDKAYDSDDLDERLHNQKGIEMIAPHRKGRKKPKTQDGRKLRRYKRRWKVERLFAWLHNFRRLVVRYEREIKMYRAFFHLACLIIVLNRF